LQASAAAASYFLSLPLPAGIGLRAFYGSLRPMPAYAVRRIDSRSMQLISISPPIFRSQRHVSIFWSKNRFFSLLPRIYAECAK